jgi:hypothetical protein
MSNLSYPHSGGSPLLLRILWGRQGGSSMLGFCWPVAQSTDHILSFLQMLRTELAFYIGCLNLRHQLTELQEPTCFPVPMPHGERKLSFAGLYDVCLALNAKRKVLVSRARQMRVENAGASGVLRVPVVPAPFHTESFF